MDFPRWIFTIYIKTSRNYSALRLLILNGSINSKSLEEKPILKAPSPKNQKKEPMSLLVLMVSKNILLIKTEVHSFLPRREQGKHIF